MVKQYIWISFAAGIIVLISGIIFPVGHMALFPSMSSMMGSPYDVTLGAFSVAIMICGAIIIGVSILMYKVPSEIHIWGVTVIVFSVLSIFEMGGFLIGGIIGIIGGILAFKADTGKHRSVESK